MTDISNKDKYPSPLEEVRTDLWPSMTLQQLQHQRDLLVMKMSKLQSMAPYGNMPPNLKGIQTALQHGLAKLDHMITTKSQGK